MTRSTIELSWTAKENGKNEIRIVGRIERKVAQFVKKKKNRFSNN